MPLFWLSCAFLVGNFSAAIIPLTLKDCFILAAGGVLAQVFILLIPSLIKRLSFLQRFAFLGRLYETAKSTLHLSPFLLLIAFFLAAARYQSAQPVMDASFIAFYNDASEAVTVSGVVVEPPDVRDTYINLKISTEGIKRADGEDFQPVHGYLLARVSTSKDWRYGDLLNLQGKLETPFQNEEFSYRDFLAIQNIYSLVRNPTVEKAGEKHGNILLAALFDFKARCLATVYRLFPDPEASLLAGILLGVDNGIPADVVKAFQDTGTSHIIAISGFNMTIVAGFFAMFFGRLLGKRKGAVASALGILAYTVLVGASAAVVRAAIMGGLSLFARQVGRRQDGLNSLAFSAALMAFFNPLILWDAGFQLSFAATLGLVLYSEPFSQAFLRMASRFISAAKAEKITQWVAEYFLCTLAAQITTLPIILYHFQRFSISAFIANPLVLPAQPPVMTLGGLAVLLGVLYEPLGRMAALIVYPFLLYTIRCVELFAKIPSGAFTTERISPPVILLFYVLLLGLTFGWQKQRKVAALSVAAGLTALAVLNVVVWQSVFALPDGRLHITLFDAGGSAVLVQSPKGSRVLINGGTKISLLADALGRRLPFLDRHLDALIISRADTKQITSLSRSLERFPVRAVYWAAAEDNEDRRMLQESLLDTQVVIEDIITGHSLNLGDGTQVKILAMGKDASTLLVTYDNFRALFPIGLSAKAAKTLASNGNLTGVTALVLMDGNLSQTNGYMEMLQPDLMLVGSSGGSFNVGSKTPNLSRARNLLQADRNGWMQISTDGKQLWVMTQR